MDQWEVLEELSSLRAEFAIRHAIRGFGMEYDMALELARNYDGELTGEEKAQREIIVAAIDNLVDFAVAQEYQMAMELDDFDELTEEEAEEEEDDEDSTISAMYDVFHKYNYIYANVENADIEYAMAIAAGICMMKSETSLIYMTQGDERVRAWHMQYEGFTAPKSSFPRWLVPPIEHGCRCYLDSDSTYSQISGVEASRLSLEMPEWFNPVFKESVAFGGRIFSEDHNYFNVDEIHVPQLQKMTKNIKLKYFNG